MLSRVFYCYYIDAFVKCSHIPRSLVVPSTILSDITFSLQNEVLLCLYYYSSTLVTHIKSPIIHINPPLHDCRHGNKQNIQLVLIANDSPNM